MLASSSFRRFVTLHVSLFLHATFLAMLAFIMLLLLVLIYKESSLI
jgi:hypothetical protein